MDIITLIVGLVIMFLIMALAWAVWWKLVDKAWDYLEELLGKKTTDWISIISVFVVVVAIIVKLIRL